MTNEPILFSQDSRGVATLTLNRERVRNAIDVAMITALRNHLTQIQANTDIRVVVINAVGPHFCAGADMHWMKSMREFTLDENTHDAIQLAHLFETLNALGKPTIALVQGHCMGGGLGILACCDIVIAQPDTQFCFSEARLGLIPATIAPYVIDAIGMRATRELFLTSQVFDAERALTLGLVTHIGPALDTAANPYIDAFLNNAPSALRDIKTLLLGLPWRENRDSQLHFTARMLAHSRISEEGQEGLSAFLEKRKPHWTQPR